MTDRENYLVLVAVGVVVIVASLSVIVSAVVLRVPQCNVVFAVVEVLTSRWSCSRLHGVSVFMD